MTTDELMFFNRMPGALSLYETLSERMRAAFPDADITVRKTQITFRERYGFAFVSLPIRKVKGWPEVCIIVSFGLPARMESPRIAVAVEPYPNRWTHHVIVQSEDEVDGELMAWLGEAHTFALLK